MKKSILPSLLLVLLHFALFGQPLISATKQFYYCTPCGNTRCDTVRYDHPGTCPVCHMALIKKAIDGPFVAKINNEFIGHWGGYAKTTNQQLTFSLAVSADPVVGVLFTATDLNAMNIRGQHVSLYADSLHFELIGDDGSMKFSGILRDGRISGAFIADDQSVAPENRIGSFELQKVQIQPVNYTVQEVTFRNKEVTLAGSLYIPNGPGKFPAIVCNHSSGDKPRYDGAFMADYLARRGIAVLIYDKRGDGQSTGDWKTSTFEDLADDCIAGIGQIGR